MYSKMRKQRLALIPIVFLCGFFSAAAFSDVVVIVHPANDAIIDKASVKKIFMGRTKTFSNGEKAIPVEIESGEIRKIFLKQYLQKDQSAIDSYWSRMIFTGGGSPPKTYQTEDDIKKLVANNPNAIGYIDSSIVDKSVKVIKLN